MEITTLDVFLFWKSIFSKKLIFVLGKGGVGRTTLSSAIALNASTLGRNTLVVQWSLHDRISTIFGLPPTGHKYQKIGSHLWVMNFEPKLAMKEYFAKYLKMKIIYSMIIDSPQVQRLIQAAPGIYELFFLGRLFWLTELLENDGDSFDFVIVDAPATGHGINLLGVPGVISQFGLTGPIAFECQRVDKMIRNTERVGSIFVTLPEELPVQECLEGTQKYHEILGKNPLGIVVNRSPDLK